MHIALFINPTENSELHDIVTSHSVRFRAFLLHQLTIQWKQVIPIYYFKTLDTIGNCQRPLFSLAVSQDMHKITNL